MARCHRAGTPVGFAGYRGGGAEPWPLDTRTAAYVLAMGERIEIRMIVEIDVKDVERFRALVEAASAITRNEPGTLIYDWYLDEETKRARLHEAYDSFESLDAHVAGPVFTELGPEFFEVAEFVDIDFYGEMPVERQHDEPLAPLTIWGAPFSSGGGPSALE